MQYEGACVFGGDQVLSPPYNATGVYSGDNSSNSNVVDGDVAQLAMQEQESTLQQQALVQLGTSLGKMPAAQYSRLIVYRDHLRS